MKTTFLRVSEAFDRRAEQMVADTARGTGLMPGLRVDRKSRRIFALAVLRLVTPKDSFRPMLVVMQMAASDRTFALFRCSLSKAHPENANGFWAN